MSFLSLLAKLGLDGSGFKAGLKEADVAARNFGKDLGHHLKGNIAAAFSAVAIEEFVRHIVEAADRVYNLAEQAGVTTDEMQEMDHAAKRVGLSFEDVAKSLGKIGVARKKAASDQEVRSTFERFGIGWERVNDAGVKNLTIEREMLENMSRMNLSEADRIEFGELVGVKAEKLLAIVKEIGKNNHPLISAEDVRNIHQAAVDFEIIKNSIIVAASKPIGNIATAMNSQNSAMTRLWAGFKSVSWALPGSGVFREVRRQIDWIKQNLGGRGGAKHDDTAGINEHSTGGGSGATISARDEILAKRQDEVAKAYDKLAESALKLEVSRMDAGEKRLNTEREITRMMAAQSEYSADEKEFAEWGAKINEKRIELEAMRYPRVSADSLQSIGNQLANANRLNAAGGIQVQSPHIQIAQKQLSVQMAMAAHLAAINVSLRTKSGFSLDLHF